MRSSGFALAAAIVLCCLQLLARRPAPLNAAASQLLLSQSCAAGGIQVRFSWQGNDPSAAAQWLDLSTSDNGWQPATFISAGPFSPSTNSYVWQGLTPSTFHVARLNQQLPDGTWDASQTFQFTTVYCAPGTSSTAPAAPDCSVENAIPLALLPLALSKFPSPSTGTLNFAVRAKLSCASAAVGNATMTATLSGSISDSCTGRSDNTGVAGCALNVGSLAQGQPLKLDVCFSNNGKQYCAPAMTYP